MLRTVASANVLGPCQTAANKPARSFLAALLAALAVFVA
jgi:hypothetical protein